MTPEFMVSFRCAETSRRWLPAEQDHSPSESEGAEIEPDLATLPLVSR